MGRSMSCSNSARDGWLWGSGLYLNGVEGSLRVSHLFVPYHAQSGLTSWIMDLFL